MNAKYLILGAGPSGLSFAHRLLNHNEHDFIILEAEHEAGGLCRSVNVDGSALDIGGGHILDVRRPEVVKFLFEFMPRSEWNHFTRDTTIHINGQVISHPFEANIWQLDLENQIKYLSSISKAGCITGKPKPEKFTDWIRWKLGDSIANDYMIPYNIKMFGEELDNLGTYWLEKLPEVSFEDTLRSCLERKAHAKQPGHAEFFYPKDYGYGEVWLRMARSLDDKIIYNQHVNYIDFDSLCVRTLEGSEYQGSIIINTIPYREFRGIKAMPEALKESIQNLRHTSVRVKYIPENIDTSAQWIYLPDLTLDYHRIFVRHNVLLGSHGVWTETNEARLSHNDNEGFSIKYAYPLNTLDKPRIMKDLLTWCRSKNFYGLGRWGEHQHYNSDLVVELAMKLADELI
ncbi:MAG: FAD-dependent oxidoreductase [Synergistaceae bacterium]|nr:FAD-dependent oxidoreductase [Synergistaceae bacterium]